RWIVSSRGPSTSINETRLSRKFSARHRSLTSPSENWPLPAPMTLMRTGFATSVLLLVLLVQKLGTWPNGHPTRLRGSLGIPQTPSVTAAFETAENSRDVKDSRSTVGGENVPGPSPHLCIGIIVHFSEDLEDFPLTRSRRSVG